MKDKWKTRLYAISIASIMLLFALLQQYLSFGEETSKMIISPIGFLSWGGSFLIAVIFCYVIIDFTKKFTKIKKLSFLTLKK